MFFVVGAEFFVPSCLGTFLCFINARDVFASAIVGQCQTTHARTEGTWIWCSTRSFQHIELKTSVRSPPEMMSDGT